MSKELTRRSIYIFAVTLTAAAIIVTSATVIYTTFTSGTLKSSFVIAPAILGLLSAIAASVQLFLWTHERNKVVSRVADYQETQLYSSDLGQIHLIATPKEVLETKNQQLELEIKRLEIQEKRLEIEKERIDYAFETASKIVDTLHPNADQETKEMLLRSLLPDLLRLGSDEGLALALPEASKDQGRQQ